MSNEKKSKKSIALLIPTKNRAESIDFYLNSSGKAFLELGVDIIIYDSTEDDSTKKVVSKFNDALKIKGIYYYEYTDKEGDSLGVYKGVTILKDTAKEYDYVWLCGDQAIININNCGEKVMECIEQGYDLVHIYNNWMGIGNREYLDEKEFFADFFWSMTHWCAFILSHDLIENIFPFIEKYLAEGGLNPIIFSIFSELPRKKYTIYYIYEKNFLIPCPSRSLSYAHTKGKMMDGWIKMIYHGFNFIPNSYNEVKDRALLGVKRNIGILSLRGTVQLRATNNINIQLFNENKKEILFLASSPIWWIKFWCLMPKLIAQITYYSYNLIHKLYVKIRYR